MKPPLRSGRRPSSDAENAQTPDTTSAVLQFRVWLKGLSPMVWRRVQVPATMSVREFHGVLQVAMGWESRYISFVHGYDRKPQRRILDHLKKQGVQANQDITFITDGGEEIRSLAEMMAPGQRACAGLVPHITMRITVIHQFAQGLRHHDKEAGNGMLGMPSRIKWYLWHGNAFRAREEINWLLDAEATETDYPNMRKFLTAIGEFQSYMGSNHASLINYGERYRFAERISSAFVEATVNAVVSKRFARKQQMQWSRTGASPAATRTQTLDGSLRSTFETWYPGMASDNNRNSGNQAVA